MRIFEIIKGYASMGLEGRNRILLHRLVTFLVVGGLAFGVDPSRGAVEVAPQEKWADFCNVSGVYSSPQAVCDARTEAINWKRPLIYDGPAEALGVEGRCIDPTKGSTLGWPRFYYVCASGYEPYGVDSLVCNGQFLGEGSWCRASGEINPLKNAGACEQESCCVGNPVTIGALNKFMKEKDYSGSGRSDIEFSRFYNSSLDVWLKEWSLGKKWSWSYSRSLNFQSNSSYRTVLVTRDDGKGIYFTKSDGEWRPDEDIGDKLEELTDGQGQTIGWRYTTSNNDTENYDNDGKLVTVETLFGVVQTVSYDGDGRIHRVESSVGQSIEFQYDTFSRISSVTDQSSRAWMYRYDMVGNLEYVDYPDGSTRQYHYNESLYTTGANLPHALTGVTDERGIRYSTYEYFGSGRTKSTYHAGNAQRVDISYNNVDGTRTVTNSLGQESIYSTEIRLGVALVTEVAGPGCSTCGTSDSNYGYDPANNNLLSKTEQGRTTEYGDYDDKSQYRYRVEAKDSLVERQADYTYDDRFHNKVTTITENSVYQSP